MRIALVIENLDPTGGGAERNCVELANRLQQRGHTITLLCGGCTESAAAALPNITLEPGPAGKPRHSLRLALFARWITARLAEDDFDVSLSFNMTAPATVLQPLGGSIHETLKRNIAMRPTSGGRLLKRITLLLSPKQHLLRHLEKKTLAHPRVQAIAALSEYVVRQFQTLDVEDHKLRVIHNAVDMSVVDDEQKKLWRDKLREAFRVDDDATAYLFAAYNPKLKGIKPLMQAFKQVVEADINAVLLLTGGVGYAEQSLAEKRGIRDRVRFIGRTVNMPAVYAAADVTVHPTFYDPSSRVVIESLLMGTPAITTSYNGASDFITRDDGTFAGRVIDEPNDVPALAKALKELADPAERVRCQKATEGLAAHLTMERHVHEIETLLQEVAGS